MADVLDMIAYRQLQRQRRRFKRDLDTLEHHPTWEAGSTLDPAAPTDEEGRKRALWAYGPEGLSDARSPESNLGAVSFEDPKPLADVVQLAPAKAKRAATLTGDYLDEILEKAYDGNTWAQFRLALIQITEEPIDEQVYIMQHTFPEMEVHQFEAYLERAIAEFDEYSDLMEENDQP